MNPTKDNPANGPVDNPTFTARPVAAAGAADQAAPTTLSTAQDVPVERSVRVDTSVFDEQTRRRAQEIIARYPQRRSALLPLLHLVQSVEGYVSQAGISFCAHLVGLTTAEVSTVATFYTMFKRRPSGEHLVSVCTNTLCAALGGDEIYARLRKKLGVGHEETAGPPGSKGSITLEHAECLAACDLAPVLQVNYEFYDNQTPESAVALVDALKRGERNCSWPASSASRSNSATRWTDRRQRPKRWPATGSLRRRAGRRRQCPVTPRRFPPLRRRSDQLPTFRS